MTLTELRYVVAVARERHFGRAAEACFVSQPTLSVAVKKLDRILPFARPAPVRRVALAWRRSFPRPEAIEVLRKAVLACNLPQVEKLSA